MGDGVLAYFGYPRAQENDAEHAVRAGGLDYGFKRMSVRAAARFSCSRKGLRRRSISMRVSICSGEPCGYEVPDQPGAGPVPCSPASHLEGIPQTAAAIAFNNESDYERALQRECWLMA